MNRQAIKCTILIWLAGVMLTSLLGCKSVDVMEERPVSDEEPITVADGQSLQETATIDPAIIAALDSDYYIDYSNGTIPLGELPIGARVVDPSWEWEFRLGVNYSDLFWGDSTPPGEVKPVTWIIVAKDHYEGLEPHVTLLSEELIALFTFDDSTDRGSEHGNNYWGESGTGNASHGLRPWLNSTGLHSGEGFYKNFSESFKQGVLTTTVPNREWETGSEYSTSDHVFIPSTTELNEEDHDWTYPIGSVYAFFAGAGDEKRIAFMAGEGLYELVERGFGGERTESQALIGKSWDYWVRSPVSDNRVYLRYVGFDGAFYYSIDADGGSFGDGSGVRPALNLKSDILVSEINH